MLSAREALERLRNGNQEFVARVRGEGEGSESALYETRRAELPKDHNPFAIVLGCCDARVPIEIIFNQGLGDLFVIRVIGNVVTPTQLGSIEYAATQSNARLVVVLGHSRCGAILTTLREIQHPSENPSRNVLSVVDCVRPSVDALLTTELRNDPDRLVREAVRANVGVSVNQLRHGSGIVEQLIQDERLAVVGAEYSLDTGMVDFFDTAGAS